MSSLERDNVQRDSLRFVSYNIHSCRSARLEPSLNDVVNVLGDAQPDVVALQEVDVDCPRTDQIHQAEEIGRRLEMTPHFFSLVDWTQFQSRHEKQGRYGLAFLSRKDLRLIDSREFHLPLLSPLSEPRGVFQIQAEWQGKSISILNTHLSVHRRENLLQMQALCELIQQTGTEHEASILLGDFNATGQSRAIRRLRTLLSECIPTGKPRATFPSRFPLLQLDRIFTGGALEPQPSQVLASPGARQASDHFPVKVELKL